MLPSLLLVLDKESVVERSSEPTCFDLSLIRTRIPNLEYYFLLIFYFSKTYILQKLQETSGAKMGHAQGDLAGAERWLMHHGGHAVHGEPAAAGCAGPSTR